MIDERVKVKEAGYPPCTYWHFSTRWGGANLGEGWCHSGTPGRLSITDLNVDVDHRREGHGRHLMEAMIEHADRLGMDTELRVYSTNEAAISLYLSLGFTFAEDPTTRTPLMVRGKS